MQVLQILYTDHDRLIVLQLLTFLTLYQGEEAM